MTDKLLEDMPNENDITILNSSKIAHFIETHADDDVRQLALQGRRWPDIDMPYVLDQIAGRQRARQKLPTWASTAGIVYPPHLNIEQCSSEPTARYKAQVATGGESMVDLTGGFGVDCHFLGQQFTNVTYVERDARLCQLAHHNFNILDDRRFRVICQTAEDFLPTLGQVSLIYLDPARRDIHGQRTYGIAECTPDLGKLLPVLFQHTNRVMVKLSPMLDWHEAVTTDPTGHRCWPVEAIHIISVDNECKELLWLLRKDYTGETVITCANLSTHGDDDAAFSFTYQNRQKRQEKPPKTSIPSEENEGARFLYEPNASIMKAGCFQQVAERYGVTPLAVNSHLMVNTHKIDKFPGRKFLISAISSMNKRELHRLLNGVTQANITTRNFPLSVADLRQQLHLREGGHLYLFATTLSNGRRAIFFCQKTDH